MVTSQKAALSLLITVIISCLFAVVSFIGFFDLLEARFYNPSITANIIRDNDRNAEVVDRFFREMQNRFSETLQTKEVRFSFLSNQSPEDIIARARIFNLLIDTFDGIQWVRFVDSGGRILHFSSYSQDLMNPGDPYPVYRNYNEPDLPYEMVEVDDGGLPAYTFDSRSERVIFSFPLYDSFDIYWGTALFSVSMDAILNRLTTEGRMRFGQNIMVISNPAGLVFGMAASGERALPSQISAIWRTEGTKNGTLISPSSGLALALISTETSQGFIVGRLVNQELFSFSQNMKIILLVSFFLTVYLIIFLLFTFRQDPVSIIQNRLKQLQISLFEQFFALKGEADWTNWVRELEHRRGEITVHLKKGIKFTPATDSTDIDALINKSWDELLQVMGSRRDTGIDEEKLRSILKDILATLPGTGVPHVPATTAPVKTGKTGLLMKATAIIQKIEDAELVEELEEVDELEELGELMELDEADEPKAQPGAQMPDSGVDLAAVASQIEFSPNNEPEYTEEEPMEQDLEIVSPFSDMLYDLKESESDDGSESPVMEVETKDNRGLSLINNPFSGMTSHDKIETLQALEDEDEITIEIGEIIEEREGVHYISQDVLDTETEAVLDRDFKDLVDSVTK